MATKNQPPEDQTLSQRFSAALTFYLDAARTYRDLPSGPNEAAARIARDTFRAIQAERDAYAREHSVYFSEFIVKGA